jgi:hypothetical protein
MARQTDGKLRELIAQARAAGPMTEAQREEQRRSFAYGNVAIENPRITRAMIDAAAAELDRSRRPQ